MIHILFTFKIDERKRNAVQYPLVYGYFMPERGPGRCSNLVKNMLTQILDAPFEKFRYAGKEEVRPEGDIMKKCRQKSPENHIAWISIVLSNIMH
jgi:hypothetical protein